nr:NS1 [Equine protoparvovirus]
MAQAQVDAYMDMETEDAYSKLQDQRDKQCLSFVFSVPQTTLVSQEGTPQETRTDVHWPSFCKQPTDQPLREVIKNNQEELTTREEDAGEPMEMDEIIERSAAFLMGNVQRAMFELFQSKGWEPESLTWFLQVEFSRDKKLHCHMLLHHEELKSVQGKWIQKFLAEKWSKYMLMCCSQKLGLEERITMRRQLEFHGVDLLTYKHKQTRKAYCRTVDFLEMLSRYFLKKKPVNEDKEQFGFILSADNTLSINGLTYSLRLGLAQRLERLLASKRKADQSGSTGDVAATVITAQENKKRRVETAKEVNIKDTVSTLFDARVCSEEEWMLKDSDSYIHFISQPGGEALVKNILNIATLRLSREMTAYMLIAEKAPTIYTEQEFKETKVYRIFERNNMNPLKVIQAIMCCLNRQLGKQNTILFHGPATTGKSIIAQTLCKLVGNTGCYNPANQNFPFNDCTNKNVIWVEEAGNLGPQVNQFKALMSGQTVRIDQKGKGSKPIEPTPLVMTTNENIDQVKIGCELRPEHSEPIRDRCVNIYLWHKLPGTFGLIDDEEWPRIFKTMESQGYQPTMASYCAKWGTTPTWAEQWGDPAIKEPLFTGSETSLLKTPEDQESELDAALAELLNNLDTGTVAGFPETLPEEGLLTTHSSTGGADGTSEQA